MNRSVTSRNLAGGFLGGAVGILISWFVAPVALPFGVLLGVVVGWWAEDVAQAFVHSSRTAARFWRWLVELIVPEEIRLSHQTFWGYVGAMAARGTSKMARAFSNAYGHAAIPFRLTGRAVRAVWRVPVRFGKWAAHPANTALLISISAIVVGAVINAVAFSSLWPWPETKTIGGATTGKPLQVVPFETSDIIAFTCLATLFLTMFGLMGVVAENSEDNSMRNFYSRWERYSRYSPITYFARELFRFFKSEIVVGIGLVLAIAYWVTLGGALIALVMIPVATLVTFMVALYKIAQRPAHWWCFGVTFVVTATSAIIFYSSFSNEVVLWTVALCTGVVSGMATEGLRRLGTWWSDTEIGQHYLDVWYDENKILPFTIARPAWRMFARAFDNAGTRLIRLAA